jgi:hypothetical protein
MASAASGISDCHFTTLMTRWAAARIGYAWSYSACRIGRLKHLDAVLLLHLGVSDRNALGLEEGEGHLAADDEQVRLVYQHVDDAYLVHDLREWQRAWLDSQGP